MANATDEVKDLLRERRRLSGSRRKSDRQRVAEIDGQLTDCDDCQGSGECGECDGTGQDHTVVCLDSDVSTCDCPDCQKCNGEANCPTCDGHGKTLIE